MKKNRLTRYLASALVLGATLIVSSAAYAQSTTIYPKKGLISASSAPMTIQTPAGNTTCTLHGGSFLPAANATGPVTEEFWELPKFTECTAVAGKAVSVLTSGKWTLTAQYGQASFNVAIPLEGIEVKVGSEIDEVTTAGDEGPLTFLGGWDNGFSNQWTTVKTAIQFGGSIMLWWHPFEKYKLTEFSPVLVTLSAEKEPQLGP